MLEYHQPNSKHIDETNSYLLASMSGRGHEECWNTGWLHGVSFPLHEEGLYGRAPRYENDPRNLPRKSLNKPVDLSDQSNRTGRLISAKETTDKKDSDDRIRWQRPTIVGGYVSHREQWL